MCPHCKRPNVELLPDPGALPSSQRLDVGSVAKEIEAEKSAKPKERRMPTATEVGRVRSSTVLEGAIGFVFLILIGLLYYRSG